MNALTFFPPLQQATINVLVENIAGRRGLLGEQGLSFWIEANGQALLLDTGQGMALEQYHVQTIGVNHCTGMKALTRLWQRLGERCFDCRVGTQLSFGVRAEGPE